MNCATMSDRLPPPPRTDHVERTIADYHADFVEEVRRAIAAHDVVVVGMAHNPHVIRARRALDRAGVRHHYLGHGSYFGGWRRRLAIKLWSGWPTFPQVFVRGTLIGGEAELVRALEDGTLAARLETAAAPSGA
jgi:glutaredoxin-related protein